METEDPRDLLDPPDYKDPLDLLVSVAHLVLVDPQVLLDQLALQVLQDQQEPRDLLQLAPREQ